MCEKCAVFADLVRKSEGVRGSYVVLMFHGGAPELVVPGSQEEQE